MSFTAPRTWVTNEVVSSSLLNTHLRDNMLAIGHPYDYSSSDLDVSNTVTETSLWSKVISGADLGSSGLLSLEMAGDFLFNNSGANTITLRVKWGGSTLFTSAPSLSSDSSTINANRKPWLLRVSVANKGATNSQYALAEVYAVDVRFETGVNGANGTTVASDVRHRGVTTAAIDTTADQTLQVTAQWSAASANLSWRKRLAVLQLGQN